MRQPVQISIRILSCLALLVPANLTTSAAEAKPPPPTAEAQCRNGFYLVQGRNLLRFDDRARRYLLVARLPVQLNALAYLPGEERLYGIAGSKGIAVTPTGASTNVGSIPHGLRGAHVAASNGSDWLIKASHEELVTVRVPDLVVVSRVRLSRHVDVGDWDVSPGDGMLYGVTSGRRPELLRIDPRNGLVSVVASLPDLPPVGRFGAVAIDAHGTLHVLHDVTGRLYHVPLARSARASFSNLGLHASGADAATCPAAWDFGDFPRLDARHTITTFGVLSIGPSVGKDDGLSRSPRVPADATSYDLPVAVRNTTGLPALLAGWLDTNNDGRFTVAERAIHTVGRGPAAVTLRWQRVNASGRIAAVRLRLRLYGEIPVEVSPVGSASGGEVEDHLLPVQRPAPPVRAPAPAGPSSSPSLAPPPPSPRASASSPSPSARLVPSPSASAGPRQPAAQPRATGPQRRQLPLTLSLFVGLLIPAITVAARAVVPKGRVR